MRRVLITGGAGFIGSHLADGLIAGGNDVRVLDNLDPQVHGTVERPDYLNGDVELQVGDIRDEAAVARAVHGVDAVVHLAACVGVGQSMYEVRKYTSVNSEGTAVLMEALSRDPVESLVVASSMSIYGEGEYRNEEGEPAEAMPRRVEDLRAGRWEPVDTRGGVLLPMPTRESKSPALESVYALGKYDQERMCLMLGRAYAIPTIALRFFNVFGPRQALSNPYTGVLAIFASRLLNGRAPVVFEDGRQQRDFVNVRDVAQACMRALDAPAAAGRVFNIGSGEPVTVLEIADRLRCAMNSPIDAEVNGQSRIGDIRHCFADISAAREGLGYVPEVGFDEGLLELTEWLAEQQPEDRVHVAQRELASRGLTV